MTPNLKPLLIALALPLCAVSHASEQTPFDDGTTVPLTRFGVRPDRYDVQPVSLAELSSRAAAEKASADPEESEASEKLSDLRNMREQGTRERKPGLIRTTIQWIEDPGNPWRNDPEFRTELEADYASLRNLPNAWLGTKYSRNADLLSPKNQSFLDVLDIGAAAAHRRNHVIDPDGYFLSPKHELTLFMAMDLSTPGLVPSIRKEAEDYVTRLQAFRGLTPLSDSPEMIVYREMFPVIIPVGKAVEIPTAWDEADERIAVKNLGDGRFRVDQSRRVPSDGKQPSGGEADPGETLFLRQYHVLVDPATGVHTFLDKMASHAKTIPFRESAWKTIPTE